MTEQPPSIEMPVLTDFELPYLPLYQRANILRILLALVPAFVGLGGILAVSFQEKPVFFAVFALIEVGSLILLVIFTRKVLIKRRATTAYLENHADEFLQAVQTRYGVTLTENILYLLAQGGTTRLPDHAGELTRMKLATEAHTTKLIITS